MSTWFLLLGLLQAGCQGPPPGVGLSGTPPPGVTSPGGGPPPGVDTSQGGGPPPGVGGGGAPSWANSEPVSSGTWGEATGELSSTLIVGVLCPITSVSTTFLASIVSADLEFRKHRDPQLRQRFGPPIINITDLNPKLQVRFQIGTEHDELAKMYHLLGYALGYYNASMTQAVVCGYDSYTGMQAGNFLKNYRLPQLGYRTSAPKLSNTVAYPYFSRTFPSDTLLTKAIWTFMLDFEIPAISCLYSKTIYGEQIFASLTALAVDEGQTYRLEGVSVDDMSAQYDFEEARIKVRQIKNLRVRIVVIGMLTDEATKCAQVLEQEGLFSKDWQFIACAEVSGNVKSAYDEVTMHDLTLAAQASLAAFPLGFLSFSYISRGSLFPLYEHQLWKKLTPNDVTGSDAISRYSLDGFPPHTPLNSSYAPLPDADMFSSLSSYRLADPFLFDACYAFIIAFNVLLNAGASIPQIRGDRLQGALRNVSFEGLTGTVAFDSNGDRRHVKYALENVVPRSNSAGGGRLLSGDKVFKRVGFFDSDTNSVTLSEDILWMTGDTRSTLPELLIACDLGHFEEAVTKVCKPCPKGSYSLGGVAAQCSLCQGGKYANKTSGASFCAECAYGRYGAEAGTTTCIDCEAGKYCDTLGARHCEVCAGGEYQDGVGMHGCKKCDDALDRMTTLYKGAARLDECGCKAGYIEVRDVNSANGTCQPCTVGLDCPEFSELLRFSTGKPYDGLVAKLEVGFTSDIADPLLIYECRPREVCIGGVPGNCKGGREGIPCARCREGETWRNDNCGKCDSVVILAWRTALPFFLASCIVAYYSLNGPVTLKAAKLLAITSSLGLMVNAFQSLAVITSINVPEMPTSEMGLRKFLTVFGADFSDVEFDCAAGHDVVLQYFITVAIFPMGIAWLCLAALLSQLCSPKYRFEKYPLASTIGSFLQLTLTTLSMVGLKPFMCYSHPPPNLQRSLTQYPEVLCGSPEHMSMQIGGILLLCMALLFLSLTTVVAFCAPVWSRYAPHRIRAFKFILFRFRMDCWAYGSLYILRGPLLTLPLVFATDYPHIQIFVAICVLVIFLVIQLSFWPWKVPILNILDTWISMVLIALVTITNCFLPVETDFEHSFHGLYLVLQWSVAFVSLCTIALAFSALLFPNLTAGNDYNPLLNLGQVPDSYSLGRQLKEVSAVFANNPVDVIADAMDRLPVQDLRTFITYLTISVLDMNVPVEDLSDFSFQTRLHLPSDSPLRNKRRSTMRTSVGSYTGGSLQLSPVFNSSMNGSIDKKPCQPDIATKGSMHWSVQGSVLSSGCGSAQVKQKIEEPLDKRRLNDSGLQSWQERDEIPISERKMQDALPKADVNERLQRVLAMGKEYLQERSIGDGESDAEGSPRQRQMLTEEMLELARDLCKEAREAKNPRGVFICL